MSTYYLHCDPGVFTLTGADVHGILTALYTGRQVEVEPHHAPASAWLRLCTTDSLNHPEFEARFLASIEEIGPAPIRSILYRGRYLDDLSPTPDSFGPPPPDQASQQRYNWAGRPVLYLSTDSSAISYELGPDNSDRRLWIQSFQLPDSLQVLDARLLSPTSFAAMVFWLIEQQRGPDSPRPALGARVADLISTRFQGMIVPGVRPGDGRLYSNVVIFSANKSWRQLLQPGAPPFIWSPPP